MFWEESVIAAQVLQNSSLHLASFDLDQSREDIENVHDVQNCR